MDAESSNREAVRLLYDAYSQDIYRYAWWATGSELQAEDVVQEVFCRAFRAWKDFRNEAAARTWLMSIARNYIYDYFRKKSYERQRQGDLEKIHVTDEATSVTNRLELRRALQQLNLHYRQAVILRYLEGFSIRESGEILGWSEAKVRSTTYRALAKLRKTLDVQDKEVTGREIGTRDS